MFLARPNQNLRDHLIGVAVLAQAKMPPKWQQIAYLAGLWHDLGKYRQEWQDYLTNPKSSKRIPHAAHGAYLALERCDSMSDPNKYPPAITYAIAGHHSGLQECSYFERDEFYKLAKGWDKALNNACKEISGFDIQNVPDFKLDSSRREMAIRILFAILVDADRLDAARVIAPVKSTKASTITYIFQSPSIDFNQDNSKEKSDIETLRDDFKGYCIKAASSAPGLFRLTGPCGIGKTLSSLAFALEHVKQNQMEGIIYVGPLRSIIEQSAIAYRNAVSDDVVLEHHSGVEVLPIEARNYRDHCERWDKPIICTSGVQFYESLFSNNPSQCRKLQAVINRVILIDEIQTIPQHLVIPILDGLNNLIEDWHCSVVLMSATQPAFDNLSILKNEVDIIPVDTCKQIFTASKKCTYRIIQQNWKWSDLARDLVDKSQVLVVCNLTRTAREGHQALGDGWIHLSARMCPLHRKEILMQVKEMLGTGSPCKLIATSLVEAGVDLDFPATYRQMTGLDSIIQTAGRCNREGRLSYEDAIATVFKLEEGVENYDPEYFSRIRITESLLTQNPDALNQNFLSLIHEYFLQVFNPLRSGGNEVQKFRRGYNFPKVAKEFRCIDNDWQQTVFLRWRNGADIIASLIDKDILQQDDWRSLQPYSVGIPKSDKYDLFVCEYSNGLRIWEGNYSDHYGVYLD